MTQSSSSIDPKSWTMHVQVTHGPSLSSQGFLDDSPLELCAESDRNGVWKNSSELLNGTITRVGDSSSFRYTEMGKEVIEETVPLIERYEPASERFDIGENEIEVTMRPHPFDVETSLPDRPSGRRRVPFSLGDAVHSQDGNMRSVSLLGNNEGYCQGDYKTEEERKSNCTAM